jgi:peptidoglycan/xylan/chitin deacetylase (PgdA/CDA1 family)
VPLEPAAAEQPVTGPGRPPLPMEGGGPHGTRRTTGDEYVALTFDDGPDPQWTPDVLELLREYDVTATFCVVGEMVEAFPELVRAIADDGHTLCNHSWNHDFVLGSRSRSAIRADLERTNAAIHEAAPGSRISYYRQPGGAWTRRVVEVAADLGMSSLHWAVDPQDWSRPGASQIAKVVSSGTNAGDIVLLHDGGGERLGTVRALRELLPRLADRHSLAALPPGVDPPLRHGLGLPVKPSQI